MLEQVNLEGNRLMNRLAAFLYALSCLCAFSISVIAPGSACAQSRRVSPNASRTNSTSAPTDLGFTAAALYDEANTYAEKKLQELEREKKPYGQRRIEEITGEQRRLAARHATLLSGRSTLAGEDLYYLGLLHALAENEDAALDALSRYLESKPSSREQAQTARGTTVIAYARKGLFKEAERALADYLSQEPVKLRERSNIERELAWAYRQVKNLERAAAHAEQAFKAATPGLQDVTSISSARDRTFLAGDELVNILVEMRDMERAVVVLEEMRRMGLEIQSLRFYRESTTRLVNLLVESGRKMAATQALTDSLAYASSLKGSNFRDAVQDFLKGKQKQLRVLGEAAPELLIAKWLDQTPATLASLRGRVVLLDFWANWCGPCLDAFPALNTLQEDYKDKGLVVLGVTKFYGQADGYTDVDHDFELSFLQRFKRAHRVSYSFAVADKDDNHRNYGVKEIPTTVLIDRKGVVRMIDVGSGDDAELRAMIEKLLAEGNK
jgi:thiol-disulfide isomerase/thioredoxin